MAEPIYIVTGTRTPIGAFLGVFADVPAPELGAVAVRGAFTRAGVPPSSVEEVVMGNVLAAGLGQAPARQVVRRAGLPDTVPALGISKVCGSGMAAVIHAARSIALGERQMAIAGGMENMSSAPYYLPRARQGYRMGDGALQDGMIFDGLWDPYGHGHMGEAAELCVQRYSLSREEQDDFATESYRRAQAAQRSGAFDEELEAVLVPRKKGDPNAIKRDEEPARGMPEKFARLRPAFRSDGTITAANASSINDGAAALLLASESAVRDYDLTPLARITGWGGAAHAPEWFTTAPISAVNNTLKRLHLSPGDIDLWEINEAFACVTLAANRQLGLDPAAVNIHGGAVALGHPIGASGARILVTLLYALKQKGLRRGVATLCIGGGEALAVVIERT